MFTSQDFIIEQRPDGKWTAKGAGYDQYIDFRTGAMIDTEEQAIEVRDALVDSLNTPAPLPQHSKTDSERIAELEAENEQLKNRAADMESAIAAILGGA